MTVVHDAPLHPTSSTTELLHAAETGDQAAWLQIVERFEPVVNSTIGSLRLQPADARDAAQGTWLRMFEHHRDIREPEALGGWLRTTARRECLKIIRDRRRADPLDVVEGPELRDRSVDVEQGVVDADTLYRLRGLVELLPPRSAALVQELFQDTAPGYTELASRLGIPVGSIGPTRGRALQRLRRLFEDGVVGSGTGCRA